jgi:hypothetical protein
MRPTIWLTAACLGFSACTADRTTNLAPGTTTAPAAATETAHLLLDKVP